MKQQIIYQDLSLIHPYEKNPRKNDGAVAAVAESIQEFGFKVPVIVDRNNVIIAGHTRYKAALQLGLDQIPCIVAEDLNDEQITAAQKFIQDGVDYLLLSAADTAGWDSVLKDAQDAGIRVILFDRTIDADDSLYEASIVSDMDKEGETAVNWLADQGLDEYNIIHIQGVMGSAAQQGRTGALDKKAKSDDNWNIVTQQTAEWNAEKAQQIVQSEIDKGTKFNVIYAENDDMAKGAVAALDKANISHGVGKDVIVMGFDCNSWALEELLNQNWNYDGQCNPYQASTIDGIIKKLEAGEKLEDKVVIMEEKGFDATTITQEDIDKYGI